MEPVAYISPPVCLEHLTGMGHPERPGRLDAINKHLQRLGLFEDLRVVTAREAADKEIAAVHSSGHIAKVTRMIKAGAEALDADTRVSEKSLEASYLAAGAALTGIDLLKEGEVRRVFCGVRPPGHHAEVDRAMGFCIFNNVAVAAAEARRSGLAERVLIIDWDVHHGNGTQRIFESSPHVFYYSLHQYPFYPGTGAASERGLGEGEGFTLNRPLESGTGDKAYLNLVARDLRDIGDRFKPQLVIISAGFDAHRQDPLGGMQLTDDGFVEMTRMVTSLADTYAGGRILSALEGGYDLDALASCVAKHMIELGS